MRTVGNGESKPCYWSITSNIVSESLLIKYVNTVALSTNSVIAFIYLCILTTEEFFNV